MSECQVTNASSPAEKIALFRSLFRGREDVYPRRFESRKTGKAGYAPACANEWVRGVCEKPKIKCAKCPHRLLLPVTDEVIRWHLSGRDDLGRDFVMGVYPMLLDEACLFLAVDFDKESWQADAGAFVETCRNLYLPVALERSRSGNGAHLWFFFAEAVSAGVARKLGSHILTETMERRPDLGLDSYDRLFPNQDTLPKGGFGNLIALPLQKLARVRGNSVFLDEQFNPHPDQWTFLSSIQRISRAQVEVLAREAETRGRVVGVRMAIAEDDDDAPWTAPPSRRWKEPPIVGPLPESIEMVLADQMERTGGEPDVVAYDKKTGEFIFFDCSEQTPAGRTSLCYDREALDGRKEHKPKNSVMDMAAALGIEVLTEEQYFELQKLSEFDTKRSSWIKTPPEIRKLGGALYCDRRYGRVFVGHNGAESYYSGRGFRGSLRV